MNILLRRRSLLFELGASISELYLFREGDQCTGVTGGWLFNSLGYTNNGSENLGKISTSDSVGCIHFSSSSLSLAYPSRQPFVSSNKINTKGYKYLCMDWSSAQTSNANMTLALYNSKTVKEVNYVASKAYTAEAYKTRQTDRFDISEYQGEYYIGGFFYKGTGVEGVFTGYIFNLWLESESGAAPTKGYTNVLDEVGYTDNMRVSASSGYTEIGFNNVDLTGYIPVSVGDVIRLRNVTMPKTPSVNYDNRIYVYDSEKNGLNSGSVSDAESYNAVFSDDTDTSNVLQFTVIATMLTTDTGYIRINAADINGASVITVNEEIT